MTDTLTPREAIAGMFLQYDADGNAVKPDYGAADNVLSALRDAGYVVVPVEPTVEMCTAGSNEVVCHAWSNAGEHVSDPEYIWEAMIAARPGAEDGR